MLSCQSLCLFRQDQKSWPLKMYEVACDALNFIDLAVCCSVQSGIAAGRERWAIAVYMLCQVCWVVRSRKISMWTGEDYVTSGSRQYLRVVWLCCICSGILPVKMRSSCLQGRDTPSDHVHPFHGFDSGDRSLCRSDSKSAQHLEGHQGSYRGLFCCRSPSNSFTLQPCASSSPDPQSGHTNSVCNSD